MLTIDIELTNRCNASCTFRPRDAVPHQGVMQPEVFERSLTGSSSRTIAARARSPTTSWPL